MRSGAADALAGAVLDGHGCARDHIELRRLHVDANIDGNHRAQFAKVPVSNQQFAVELRRQWRIGNVVDHDHTRLRMVRVRKRELGFDGEHEWTR